MPLGPESLVERRKEMNKRRHVMNLVLNFSENYRRKTPEFRKYVTDYTSLVKSGTMFGSTFVADLFKRYLPEDSFISIGFDNTYTIKQHPFKKLIFKEKSSLDNEVLNEDRLQFYKKYVERPLTMLAAYKESNGEQDYDYFKITNDRD